MKQLNTTLPAGFYNIYKSGVEPSGDYSKDLLENLEKVLVPPVTAEYVKLYQSLPYDVARAKALFVYHMTYLYALYPAYSDASMERLLETNLIRYLERFISRDEVPEAMHVYSRVSTSVAPKRDTEFLVNKLMLPVSWVEKDIVYEDYVPAIRADKHKTYAEFTVINRDKVIDSLDDMPSIEKCLWWFSSRKAKLSQAKVNFILYHEKNDAVSYDCKVFKL